MKKILFIGLSFFVFVNTFANRNLPGVNIISRQQWGADSKYLFSDYQEYKDLIKKQHLDFLKLKKNKQKYQKYLENVAKERQRETYLLTHWRNQVRADRVKKYLNNRKLWWKLAYKNNKTSIIVHHTAANYEQKKIDSKEKVEKYLRGTYYFHAIKRRWGDIGYNFVIDQFGNIYEGRQGGEGVVGANSKRNNVSSIGIALIGNFNVQKPTKAQLDALIRLSTALAKKYNINPYNRITYHKEKFKKAPYILDVKNYAIVGHKDTGWTACPGTNLYKMLPYVREQVYQNLKNKPVFTVKKNQNNILNLGLKFSLTDKIVIKLKSVNNLKYCDNLKGTKIICSGNTITLQKTGSNSTSYQFVNAYTNDKKQYKIKIRPIFMDNIRAYAKKIALKYLNYNVNKYSINKVKYKVSKSDLAKLIKEKVKVLLYELSFFKYYDISCTTGCNVYLNSKTIHTNKLKIDKLDKLIVWIDGKAYTASSIKITSNNGEIVFNNYNRKSYAKIPWNTFKGDILIKKDKIKIIGKKVVQQYVVINELSLNDYLQGIAEANDQMPFEKMKLMALLIKSYILFYMNKKNIHPSIPQDSSYNAVDDPRIFQKYVGAGYERTSKNWGKALSVTNNQYLLYNNYVPILPYFSCSKGFTFSAKQKFGRNDTPYLVNNIDLGKCSKFYGHGVGLSGKGAEVLAKKGLNYKQILLWYFPGVYIYNLK